MKNSNTKNTLSITIQTLAGASLIFLATTLPTSAEENVTLHGKTIGEWSAGWWQWQEKYYPDFSFGGEEVNPETGEVIPETVDCSLGQSGPVWYLGGTGGGIAERVCAAPIKGHKHLMFPLVNANIFNPDDWCTAVFGDPNCSVEQKREILDGLFSEDPPGIFNSTACVLQADVDGVPAVFSSPTVRTQTLPFQYAEDSETVADGFWVVLAPLASGAHTIHFTGGICDIESGDVLFNVDATYDLTIK